jgi:NADPH-dependent 2,4-dienoyl-CoA reductase/sulfur reductase-like enzyme
MINRHILEHHIDLKLETNLVEILQMKMVTQELLLLIKEKTIACEIVGLTAGVSPNVDS